MRGSGGQERGDRILDDHSGRRPNGGNRERSHLKGIVQRSSQDCRSKGVDRSLLEL